MPSIPSSPATPSRTRPRRSLNLDLSPSISSNPYHASNGTRSSRRSSRTSQTSVSSLPVTPRQQLDRRKSASLSIASDGVCDVLREGEGMENLADELADAWDEDGAAEPGSSFLEGLREGSVDALSLHDEMVNGSIYDQSGIHGTSPTSPLQKPIVDAWLTSPTRSAGNVGRDASRRHTRGESGYSESDYRKASGVEGAEWMSQAMAREMAKVEALARGLHDDSVSEAGGVVSRTVTALRDLGAQSSIEQGVTRVMTAYTSIVSHRMHKGRELLSTTQCLLRDRYATSIGEEEIDEVISELDVLVGTLQLPTGSSPLQSLQGLVASTTDLTHSLRLLSDLVQECRQAASAASRRLKTVRDFVMELRQEEELREEGIEYVEKGEWDRRIREREAQSVCKDVVAGFETTCNVWRVRLFGSCPC